MTEPFFVAQTAEPEHLADPQEWFRKCGEEAAAKGGTWPRYTVDRLGAPPTCLLFECWKERPEDPGEIRWVEETP